MTVLRRPRFRQGARATGRKFAIGELRRAPGKDNSATKNARKLLLTLGAEIVNKDCVLIKGKAIVIERYTIPLDVCPTFSDLRHVLGTRGMACYYNEGGRVFWNETGLGAPNASKEREALYRAHRAEIERVLADIFAHWDAISRYCLPDTDARHYPYPTPTGSFVGRYVSISTQRGIEEREESRLIRAILATRKYLISARNRFNALLAALQEGRIAPGKMRQAERIFSKLQSALAWALADLKRAEQALVDFQNRTFRKTDKARQDEASAAQRERTYQIEHKRQVREYAIALTSTLLLASMLDSVPIASLAVDLCSLLRTMVEQEQAPDVQEQEIEQEQETGELVTV